MDIDYSRDFISATADLAKKYGVCGSAINFGKALLIAIHDSGESKYNVLFDRLQLPFGERSDEEIHDEVIRQDVKMCIAYLIREKGVRVVMSSDAELNRELINGLFLSSVASNAIL